MRFSLEEELAKQHLDDEQNADSAFVDASNVGNPTSAFSASLSTGRGDLLSLPNFLYTMELQLMLKDNITDRQKIGYVLVHFQGPDAKWGATWVRNNPIDTSYDSFLAALQSHFGPQLDPHRLLNLIDRISEATSGIERYNDQFSTIWSLMPNNFWTEDGVMAAYTRRLTQTTQKLVYISQPRTLQEAMNAAYNTISLNQCQFSAADTRSLFDPDREVNAICSPLAGFPFRLKLQALVLQ